MSAAERLVGQLEARRVRDNEWRARCPVHEGKSDGSLSIKDTGDRVLVHCFSGCQLRDILAALGMKSAAELFNSMRTAPDPAADRKARAIRGLEAWSERKLVVVCQYLREIDETTRFASMVMRKIEDGELQRDPLLESSMWSLLGTAFHNGEELEGWFAILNGKDLQAKLDLWRAIAK